MITEEVSSPDSRPMPVGGWRWGGPKVRPNPHISYKQPTTPFHRTIASLLVKYAPTNARVIEVGCGIGRLLGEIQRRSPDFRLTGADIDPECLRIAGENVNLERTFLVGPETDIAQELRGEFDVMVCSHVLEHTSSPTDFLRRHLEVLKPGGIAALAVPNPVRPDVIVSSMLRMHYVNRGHVQTWDRSHWINFLETIMGLEVITYASDYVPLGPFRRVPGFHALERGMANLFPWFSFSHIALVRV